ncbi:TonB-dependent receptor family protein [Blastomonas aquatica]|uniref:TonB-dependent receptor n=1 Tax=Blastomonas aquatica TaxID=1510276 RepID=A0ABQ1JPC8_9SPHN|nr:TonB-dependent receptor [Blastomonas aquatica]GGB72182.1 TonB-dependent receptor [Blastomonas aquatica]
MKNTAFVRAALLGGASFALVSPALAQGVGQRSDPVIVVTAYADGSPTAPSVEQARQRLEQVPGGVGLVEDSVFAEDFAQSIGDVLVFTPGVFADTSAQRESRISIRGSGLNSGFERRGLTVLRDGVPISRASGSTEFQEIDPLTIRYLEVFKGANGLQFGAASLGGAVNIVSPTGRTARSSFAGRLEGGSFNTLRGNVSASGVSGSTDYYIGLTGLRDDGFREHSEVRSLYGHGNIGLKLSENVETRFYVTALSDNFELNGSLRLADALANPRAAGRPVTVGPFRPGGPVTVLDPGPVADDWDRNLDVLRLSNLTAITLGSSTLEIGGWYARRTLDHAITRFAGIIDQKEDEFGVSLRALGEFTVLGDTVSRWKLGGSYAQGDTLARRHRNLNGERAGLTNESAQDSANLTAFGQLDLRLTGRLTAIAGGQYVKAIRDVDAILAEVSGRGEYEQFSPRIGVLYALSDTAQLYGNINRSFEPPTLADLTSGGALPFAPLKEQRATTYEIGSRGQADFLAWDISLYSSKVENEFLDFGVPGANGFVSFTANADTTIHQGVEFGLDVYVARDVLAGRGQAFTLRGAYTFNDFRFDDDVTYGDNQLAGVPRHVFVSEARFEQKDSWYVSANLRWVFDGPWADFANTERAPGYELIGLTAGVDLVPGVRLFGSVENLFDTVFISNVATNANQSLERAAIYTPGVGRAIYGGITAQF